MNPNNHCRVKVEGEFFLEMGAVQIIQEENCYLIQHPAVQLFDQLIQWLDTLPSSGHESFNYWKFGIGATALCVRWGTWLAALFDQDKPVDPRAKNGRMSMISDSEMKRINIETSANLARLLQIWHEDEYRFFTLLFKAYRYLPMPQRQVRWDLNHAALVGYLLHNYEDLYQQHGDFIATLDRSDCIQYPYRWLANAMINTAYRNGPIEDIHAGSGWAYLLDHRRVTNAQARTVLRSVSERLSGMLGGRPAWEAPQWPENLLGLRLIPLAYPSDWSLVESCSEVRLPRSQGMEES
jgi:hypothetical protein